MHGVHAVTITSDLLPLPCKPQLQFPLFYPLTAPLTKRSETSASKCLAQGINLANESRSHFIYWNEIRLTKEPTSIGSCRQHLASFISTNFNKSSKPAFNNSPNQTWHINCCSGPFLANLSYASRLRSCYCYSNDVCLSPVCHTRVLLSNGAR